jgi:hypothetical protein
MQRLVEAAIIELKRVGKDLAGRCPFHEVEEPRLIVTSARTCGIALAARSAAADRPAMKLKGVSSATPSKLLKVVPP